MKVFIILAGLLMLGACTGKPEGFVLKGELKGAPDDHWVFLTNTGQTHYYDSTRLKNGRFEFKGKVDGPELRCITYFKDPSQRVFGWDKILNIPVYVKAYLFKGFNVFEAAKRTSCRFTGERVGIS